MQCNADGPAGEEKLMLQDGSGFGDWFCAGVGVQTGIGYVERIRSLCGVWGRRVLGVAALYCLVVLFMTKVTVGGIVDSYANRKALHGVSE
jgi:hypothetical protein